MAFPGKTSKYAPGVSTAKGKAEARKASRAEKRAQRMEDFKNQNIQGANQFNFNQHNPQGHTGSTHVSRQEINFLRKNNKGEGGRSKFRDNLNTLRAQKESGATFGKGAERRYQRMEKRAGEIDAAQSNMKHIENLPKGMDPSDPDVRKAFRGKGWGAGDQARYDKIIAAKQKAQAAKPGDDKPPAGTQPAVQPGGSTGQPKNPIDQTVTGENDAVPDNQHMNYAAVMPSADQEQQVKQDNDITTKIDGNNNKVFNHQDNSIRQYGGSNRTFVYQGGSGGSGTDAPVSAATMGGFYDVDDSPAAQAQFNDMYKDFNKDNGTRFAGEAMKTMDMFAVDARSYTPESMENWLGKSEQYSYDKADEQTAQVFGDIWNKDYITEDWKMPTAPKAIESNADEIADKAKEDIDDI